MLDKLREVFREDLQYTHTAGLLQQINNLIQIVNGQFMKEPNGKNAAIDIVCEILQSHKDPVILNNGGENAPN